MNLERITGSGCAATPRSHPRPGHRPGRPAADHQHGDQTGDGERQAHRLIHSRTQKELTAGGIRYRTLLPGGAGATRVYIFDRRSRQRESVNEAAANHGIKVEVWKGKGRFIGAETREEGRRACGRIIADYESAHPGVRGRNVSGHAGGDHRRAGQAKALTGGLRQSAPKPFQTQVLVIASTATRHVPRIDRRPLGSGAFGRCAGSP